MAQALVICGPTATGKTALAVECAKKLNSPVISADSQLVYKGLDIGTAKPTEEEKAGVTHYMIDVCEPYCDYSVSDYCDNALPIVESVINNGKVPVICGGTGFYINSLLFDFSYGNVAADENIRNKYLEIARTKGREYLHSLLEKADPESAAKLHPNDVKRVIRALEIYEVGGRKKSEISDGGKRFSYLAVAVAYPREELYQRIERRVDAMFENGLVEEVQSLLARGIDENCRCMQAIGYKEVLECLKNGDNQSTMRDIIKQNTRRYAKRQITFFKKLDGIVWLKPEEASAGNVLEIFYNGKR
ncbi:MAG: tRNA (adenosine(37)-N6)-dimethylallyltransferase MiaA [Clostridia bacterium]|nr:tRNA (adenosine(37)-N6)-dimethylallyltransferase MiaA [Clostridia bacterium]